eukprot:Skav234075  [mRNA]  locus=scaffold2565:111240:117778:+ [translate_table: standard]
MQDVAFVSIPLDGKTMVDSLQGNWYRQGDAKHVGREINGNYLFWNPQWGLRDSWLQEFSPSGLLEVKLEDETRYATVTLPAPAAIMWADGDIWVQKPDSPSRTPVTKKTLLQSYCHQPFASKMLTHWLCRLLCILGMLSLATACTEEEACLRGECVDASARLRFAMWFRFLVDTSQCDVNASVNSGSAVMTISTCGHFPLSATLFRGPGVHYDTDTITFSSCAHDAICSDLKFVWTELLAPGWAERCLEDLEKVKVPGEELVLPMVTGGNPRGWQ